ncbi:MAG: hypothetical protein LBT89_02040 [Planctomycetaceae bacterium]|jgi:hypothetical protein|nr:hypothetical protein [Planctomycetaceae bacterium]
MGSITGTVLTLLYIIYLISRAVAGKKDESQQPPVIILDEPVRSKRHAGKKNVEGIVKSEESLLNGESTVRSHSGFTGTSSSSFLTHRTSLDTPSSLLPLSLESVSALPVKAEPSLGSLTGIYDSAAPEVQGTTVPSVNLFHFLTTPESVRHAVVLSEILGQPKGIQH